jgi:cytochrome c
VYAAVFLIGALGSAAAVSGAQTLGVGRPLAPADTGPLAVLPDGRGLPGGRGSAAAGKEVYARRCASCHGPTGSEGPYDRLSGGAGSLATPQALKTVGSFWPYATTLWDYIHRTMPYDRPGSLSIDDTYAVTAYVLHLNGIVAEHDLVSDDTLPRIRMPNRDGFIR